MKTFFVILISILITHHSYSQVNKNRLGDTILELRKSVFNKTNTIKRVLLFKDSLITIEADIRKFEGYQSWELANEILTDKDSVVDALKLAIKLQKNDIYKRVEKTLTFFIADLIEKDECWIIKTRTNEFITSIKKEKYSFSCGSLCGEGGRKYYIGDILFLTVIDWVS